LNPFLSFDSYILILICVKYFVNGNVKVIYKLLFAQPSAKTKKPLARLLAKLILEIFNF